MITGSRSPPPVTVCLDVCSCHLLVSDLRAVTNASRRIVSTETERHRRSCDLFSESSSLFSLLCLFIYLFSRRMQSVWSEGAVSHHSRGSEDDQIWAKKLDVVEEGWK